MKWGWVFLGIYVTYSISGAIFISLVELWRSGVMPGTRHHYIDYAPSYLTSLLFYGCCIWFIYKNNVRDVYMIDKYLGIITAATGAFLALLTIVLVAA
jgi:hypothetical protein